MSKLITMIKEQHCEEPNYMTISKINKFIYLGSFEHPFIDSEEFQKLGIDVIFNCSKEIVYTDQNKYIIENFQIVDGDSISMLENMDKINNKIVYYLSESKKIYLHCVKGISRSPTVLIYYLMSQKKFTYDNALSLLKNIRPVIDIDPEFENLLRTIEEC
jgi:hypothetical protein